MKECQGVREDEEEQDGGVHRAVCSRHIKELVLLAFSMGLSLLLSLVI